VFHPREVSAWHTVFHDLGFASGTLCSTGASRPLEPGQGGSTQAGAGIAFAIASAPQPITPHGTRRPTMHGGTETTRPSTIAEGPELGTTHHGRFYSRFGPDDGALRVVDCPGGLDVFGSPDTPGHLVGRAVPVARRPGPRGAIVLFRVIIDHQALAGLWECQRRKFVPVGERGAGG
jgi:hypothetical protein